MLISHDHAEVHILVSAISILYLQCHMLHTSPTRRLEIQGVLKTT